MQSALQSTTFPLRDLAILDSGATIHVFNDLSRFSNFKKAPRGDYLLAARSEVPILGYGDVSLQLKNGKVLRLKNVAFCTDFVTNLVSFRLLKANGIFWNTVNNTLFREIDSSIICSLKEIAGQQVIEENSRPSILAAQRVQRRRGKPNSRMPRPASKGDGALWHARMGHPGPMSLHKLGANCLSVVLCESSTTECQFCAQIKIKQQISQRSSDQILTVSC
jgi:hypothetical protein